MENQQETSATPQDYDMRCKGCLSTFKASTAKLIPLDFIRNQDGTLSTTYARASVFCPSCDEFLLIWDSYRTSLTS